MAEVDTQKQQLPQKSYFSPNRSGSLSSLKKQAPELEDVLNAHDDADSQIDHSEEDQTEVPEEATNGANGQTSRETNGHDDEVEDGESSAVPVGTVDEEQNVVDDKDNVIGKVNGHSVPAGSIVDQEGDVLTSEGDIIGTADLEGVPQEVQSAGATAEKPELNGPFGVQDNGEITNAEGVPIGKLAEGDPQELVGRSIQEIDDHGHLKADSGSTIGKADLKIDVLEKADDATTTAGKDEVLGLTPKPSAEVPGEEISKDIQPDTRPDLAVLEGLKVNKLGKIVNEKGMPVGQLVEGVGKQLVGRKCDAEGQLWNDSGKVVGRAELLPEDEREENIDSAPFDDFPESIVDAKGNVVFEGRMIGKVVQGDLKNLESKRVDSDGDICDKHGNVVGKAERVYEDEIPAPEEPQIDLSSLEGKQVNKAGNVVSENKIFGRVVSGDIAKLVGLKCDAEGKIWSNGKVIGSAELVEAGEREILSEGPFEDFPDATVNAKGDVIFEGQVVGKLIEGDAKQLAGKKVDKDGEILSKIGSVIGKATRYIEEDQPDPEVVDMSALAGKRVNKLGWVVDTSGSIYGKLVEGDPKKLASRMCDKFGNVRNEGGDIVGRAELVPDSEREGEKTGPFADFESAIVAKDGKVSDSHGSIIGRIIQGDTKILFGKPVDADGDILDRNGNTLGKAERWEEETKELSKHPAAGRKVNRQGEVRDENGDLIAQLTPESDVNKCALKEVDNDGDVYDSKNVVVGHVILIEDIPAPAEEPDPEPKESEEEVEAKKQLEQDKKLAAQLASCISVSIDKIKPILRMITDAIDATERQPKEERDEQKLVDTVRPLLEEGGQILQEANGVIRGLDPDGRIQANAKHKTAAREATPEEYRLADSLKELTGSVTQTIEQAKKKIAGMPHAKKELNPLWGLLAEPLGQILAAVGLLLSGVLGLVGRLLSGLGLGGLLDNLLGGLGIKGILKGLGLGMVTESLTGKK